MNSSRKLAAILFADIVGYTSLMQSNEQLALQTIQQYQSIVSSSAKSNNGEILKSYGDGSLLIFQNSLEAVQAAKTIQEKCNDPSSDISIPLRIGIHVGEFVVRDKDIYGNGVNLASRLESIGVAGSVLFSRDVYRKIKNNPELKVVELGNFGFKNVEEIIEVFALANEGMVIPKKNQLAGIKRKNSSRNLVFACAVGAVLLMAIALWVKNMPDTDKGTEGISSVKEKESNSLAVLPFTNMSSGVENQYFCDGMHDDLLTYLSQKASMKVISRTSVLRFRDTELSIPEIANELGVSHILESSFRRADNQIRINVQLIDAKTDEHVWADIFDYELNTENVFRIQTEVTKNIASALDANLSGSQVVTVDEKPTSNLEAYEAYLKGRQIMVKRNTASLFEAKGLFEKAISFDADFAQALIQLGTVHHLMISYSDGDVEENRKKSIEYLERGLSINPNMAEAYALKAIIHENQKEPEQAKLAFEKAIQLNPNHAITYHWYALFARDIERDRVKAQSLLEQGRELDPLSPSINYALGRLLFGSQEFEEGKYYLKKALKSEPSYPSTYLVLPLLYTAQNRLDSAALLAIQNLKTNGNRGIYFEHSMYPLYYLGMDKELLAETTVFEPQNRQDSLIKYRSMLRSMIHIKKDLNKAHLFVKEKDFLSRLEILFSMKKWTQYTQLYEELNPKVIVKEYEFGPTGISPTWDYFIFQSYLFALKMDGRRAEYEDLWGHYHTQVNVDEAKLNWANLIWKDYVLLRQACTIEKKSEAVDLLEKIRKNGGFGWIWRRFDQDPIFDILATDERYIRIMKEWHQLVEDQRSNVRRTLIESD